MRNVNVRFVPHGKFAWKLYPHSLLFLEPGSFSAHHWLPHLPPHNILKNGFGCFLAMSMFAESLCKSRDVERGNGEEQKQAVYFYISMQCLLWIYITLIYGPARSQRHSGMQQEDLIQHIWIWTTLYWLLVSGSALRLPFLFCWRPGLCSFSKRRKQMQLIVKYLGTTLVSWKCRPEHVWTRQFAKKRS